METNLSVEVFQEAIENSNKEFLLKHEIAESAKIILEDNKPLHNKETIH